MRRCLFILIVMVTAAGCRNNQSLQHNLREYQERMANILDVAPPKSQKISLLPYPSIKELDQNIPVTTIKLFEFYNLKHCELYSLVAQRNTSLGMLQLPSTRYIYEKNLIDALKKCLISTAEPKLKNKLSEWQHVKVIQLPLVWANLIQLSSEMKYGFSTNVGLVEGNAQDGLSETKEALNYLLNLNPSDRVYQSELEQRLQSIMNNPLPAKLWLSQRTLAENLRHSTQWLRNHTQGLQCSGNVSKKKLEYLTNVFQTFFIEKIQPIASQINHYQYQLGPIFENITSNPHLSPNFKEYIKQFNQNGFKNYQREMLQHIQFWQKLFKRCSMTPGQR